MVMPIQTGWSLAGAIAIDQAVAPVVAKGYRNGIVGNSPEFMKPESMNKAASNVRSR